MRAIAVFDTNTLFSAIGWRGAPFSAVELARGGSVEGLTCSQIINELEEKLRLKTKLLPAEIDRSIADLMTFLRLIQVPGLLQVVAQDPDDDVIVECAVMGNATHIVTGDKKHLLPLKNYQGIVICNSTEFV